MHREQHTWRSPRLNRDMTLAIWGHAGARVLVFPTSQGRYFEFSDRGMIDVMADSINRGWVQVYCVDSVDAESWYAYHKHPAARFRRHAEYDNYVLEEVLPLSQHKNPNPFLITLGCSFGGFHALSFGLRHPTLVNRILCLSGLCDISSFADGYSNNDLYFHNPAMFISHEHDERRLAALRAQDIILAVGKDDRLCEGNKKMSGLLWSKGIGNALRLWDGWSHDWQYWDKMIRLYLSGHD
ncbi:MAG: alpha/beta hydrolase-fold protein [Gemmatales bacterium]